MTQKHRRGAVKVSGAFEGIFRLEPKTKGQEEAIKLYESCDVMFLLGPAGTGKTTLGVGLGLKDIIGGKRERMIVSRPAVEAGEKLGFLKGDVEDKFEPYLAPVIDCMGQILWRTQGDKLPLVPVPLGHLRGWTFRKSVAILDEAQNATYGQLKMVLTRLGDGGKLIFCGDPEQSDLHPKDQALEDFVERIRDIPGVGVAMLTEADCCRHPIVKAALRRLR